MKQYTKKKIKQNLRKYISFQREKQEYFKKHQKAPIGQMKPHSLPIEATTKKKRIKNLEKILF